MQNKVLYQFLYDLLIFIRSINIKNVTKIEMLFNVWFINQYLFIPY